MHSHYSINKFNSWRLGTTVRYFSEPSSRDSLVEVYTNFQHERTIFLGLGSNILFPDYELNAHIIKTKKALSNMVYDKSFYVESGVSLAKFAKFCVKHGYADAAFLAGIPGTIGGALRMNAGAYGYEIWQYVKSVEVLTKQGVRTLLPKDFAISYRNTVMPDDCIMFLSATLSFCKDSSDQAKSLMKTFLLKRNATQPIGTYNCGSVFKNPEGMSAGKMIDNLGLLGYQIGNARISPVHGNFIENIKGMATSEEVTDLIYYIKQQVLEKHHVELSLEVTVYE